MFTAIKNEFWWSIHNIIAHPLGHLVWWCSLCGYFKKVAQLSHAIHDLTVPNEYDENDVFTLGPS